MSKNIKNELFNELDVKREKSHQLNVYPSENSYQPKDKITSYKKKYTPPLQSLIWK